MHNGTAGGYISTLNYLLVVMVVTMILFLPGQFLLRTMHLILSA